MRHFFAAHAVAMLPRGMMAPSDRRVLVALPGPAQRRVARFAGATVGAIHLAAVTATADDDLDPAACTQEQPCRRRLVVATCALNWWTNAKIAGILTLHACPARVWGTAPSPNRQVQIGAALALSIRASFYPEAPARVSGPPRQSPQRTAKRWMANRQRIRPSAPNSRAFRPPSTWAEGSGLVTVDDKEQREPYGGAADAADESKCVIVRDIEEQPGRIHP